MNLVNKKEEKNYARRYANEYHLLRALFHVFTVCISYPLFKIVYRVKIMGKENIPKGSKYIFAANHVSMLDPVLVSYAIKKPIVYMAKKELFEREKLGWWIKNLGAFLVNQQKPEIATFKTIKEVFKTTWSLGIFPQGGIRENKKIEDIQRGFAVIAQHSQADIIPVSISGFEGYSKKPFSQKLVLTIGNPISHKLSCDDIIENWVEHICTNTGFENCMKKDMADEKVAV